MHKKSVLLFSGGPDSVSAAFMLKPSTRLTLFTAHEPRRTKNNGEVASALKIAKILGVSHKVVDISSTAQLFDDIDNVAVGLGGGSPASEKGLAQISRAKRTCVAPDQHEAPFSVALLHLSAAMYASTHDVENVVWAVHRDDDTPAGWIAEYTKRFNTLLSVFGKSTTLSTPFLRYSKVELLGAGIAAGAPLEDTFSCLADLGTTHCGQCHGCVERATAFGRLGIATRKAPVANVA